MRRHQAQGWWYLSFVNVNKYRDLSFVDVNRARNWDLSFVNVNKYRVCSGIWEKSRFYGEKRGNHCHRFNVNVTAKWICGLTILWMRIGKWLWRSRPHGEKRGNCCHRFNVNVTAKCICGLTILWTRIGKWFWRGDQMGTGPLGFLANPQLSTGLSRASHAIPLSMMSCRGLMLGLQANIFLYP